MALDVDDLIAPLDPAQPCGPNLEYDADFLALEAAARGRDEQQFGDMVIPAEPPDWRDVTERATRLLARTRDLRVAVIWLRGRTHLEGLSGFAAALEVMTAWIAKHWEHVHPQLDLDDDQDATMRVNALVSLSDVRTVLADVRAAPVAGTRGSISVREVELALGKSVGLEGETVLSAAGVRSALQTAERADPGCLAAMVRASEAGRALERELTARLGDAAPDLKLLMAVLQTLFQAASMARPDGATASVVTVTDETFAPSHPLESDATIRNRADAARQLEVVCDWLERHEPSNPAPILVRRAVRVMSMNFVDIVRDLAPDGASQVERLAGSAQ